MVHSIYTSQYRVCCRKGERYAKTAGRNYRPLLPFKSGRRTGRREQQYCKSKEYLLKYAKEHGFSNPKFYVDDGYTGTNFDRPSFKELTKGL